MLKNLFQLILGNDKAVASDLSLKEMDAVTEIQYKKVKLDRELGLRADSFMRSI